MSYELSGFGAAPHPRLKKTHRIKGAKLPHPASIRTGGPKRRARPKDVLRFAPRLMAQHVQASNLSGLGFSLKPPRWVRKLTIKKVIKPLAITAAVVGAAFIPGALPLVGKAVGLVAKGGIGAGRLLVKGASKFGSGFMSRFKLPARAQTTVPVDSGSYSPPPPDPRPTGPSGTLGPSEPVPYNPPTYAPSEAAPPSYSYGGGGGGYAAAPEATTESPAQAGASNSLIPIGIGLVALIAVSGALRRGR